MKFTDGFWQPRPGVTPLFAQEAYEIVAGENSLTVTAPTKVIQCRGYTLNRPTLTVTFSSPLPNIVGVRIEHFQGLREELGLDLVGAESGHGTVSATDTAGTLTTGELTATVATGAPWNLSFRADGRTITSSGHKSIGYLQVAPDVEATSGLVGSAHVASLPHPVRSAAYVHEQLSLGVGELVYGLGERFGPLVKNGQTVDVCNADGGTSSEQAYKNVPFYLTNRGYGVLVNHPGHVSYEVGSDAV